MMITYSGTC